MKTVILDDAGRYVRDCTDNEVGLLTISGPNVFAGYLQDDHNKSLWLDLGDGRQWLNTGDLARRDAQGYFWLTGRRKELIIRGGGHNIDPATIEEPLHRHPAVQIAAAIGRPDVHAGELPVAYVQLKGGATATEAELDTFIRGAIGERAALPKRIHIVDAMPLTAVGKIFKPELKRRETLDSVISALRDAGVEDARVSVADDQSRGLALHVALHDHTQISVADTVMGRFPFEFSISVEPGNR